MCRTEFHRGASKTTFQGDRMSGIFVPSFSIAAGKDYFSLIFNNNQVWIWIKQDLKQNVIYIVFTFLLCGDQCGVIDKYTLM